MSMRAETSKGIVCGGPLAVRRSLTCAECHKVFKSRGNLIWHAEACLMEAFENEVYTVNSDRISKLYIPPLKTPLSNTSGISVKSTDDNTRHERIQVKIGDNSPSKPGTSSESPDKEASSPKRIEGPGGITLMVSVEKNSADELDEPPILDAQDLTMEPFEESLDDRDEEEMELSTLHLNKMRSTTTYNTHVIGALANATDDGYKPKMECPTCGIVLYRHNFAAHYRIHTGELPFHCSYCGKRFRTTSQLKVHIRAHTGEKPYACKRCEYATITKRNLDRHTLIHHVHMPKVKGPIARKGRTMTKYQDRPPELLDESDWPGVNDLNQSFEDDHKYLQEEIPEDDLMEEVEEEHITNHQAYQDLEDL